MLSGQEKAKLLLSMLGDRATAVLSLVSPANAMLLTSTIEDSPKHSPAILSGLVTEIMGRVAEIRESAASESASLSDGIGEDFMPGASFSAFDSIGEPHEDNGLFGETKPADPLVSTESADEPVGPKQRTPDEIAARLMREKPQISAFILSRFDESLRESVVGHLTYEYRDQVAQIKVERVPLSDSVFSKIYDQIVMDDGAGSVDANSNPSAESPSLFSFS